MIIFHFMTIMLKKPILKVDLNCFKKCVYLHEMSDLIKWFTSRWNIDVRKIKANENLKDICVLSNYACYDHNISNFQCKVSLNTILNNHFQTYFQFIFIKLFKICM